ncbi:MAG: HAD family hydrolase, partial [Cyanobacteria bacterium Co-bin8]|nr:HAD family hydrolase [Cyanobacteria bacterium Co-bin8]
MTQLQALIFDVDGTLAETERDGHRLAFNRAFADFDLGWDWPVGLYGRLLTVTGGKERIRHYIEHYKSSFVPEPDMATFCKALHQAKTEHF